MKLRRNYLKTDERVKLTQDYNAGMKVKDIQTKYKVSHQTIYNILHKEI
jgi:Mor family transcriptional regulator